jgi:ABC-type multidrug transport system fused ATPase/permease subunit
MLIPFLSPKNDVSFANDFFRNYFSDFQVNINQIFAFYLIMVLLVFALILNYFVQILEQKLSEKSMLKMKKDFLNQITITDWCFLKKRQNANLFANLSSHIDLIQYGFRSFIFLITTVIQCTGFLVLSLLISWKISLIVLMLFAPFYALYFIFVRKIKKSSKEDLELKLDEIHEIQNLFSDLKSLILSPNLLSNKLKTNFDNQLVNQLKLNKLTAKNGLFLEILQLLVLMTFFLVILKFQLPILPQLLVLVFLFIRLFPLFKNMLETLFEISKISPFIDNFRTLILDLKSNTIAEFKPLEIECLNQNIVFKEVSFNYGKNQLFNCLSFEIKVGEINRIKGRSGAGKTTVIEILLSLLKPSSGEVLINGEIINNNRIDFKSISYISQENFFPNCTILAYLQTNFPHDEEKINKLISSKEVFCFLRNCDLHTEIGEGGTRFSAGERQRIALLRVVLDQLDFIILDEATSYLDKENEVLIFELIKKLNSTILFVSHRDELDSFATNVIQI